MFKNQGFIITIIMDYYNRTSLKIYQIILFINNKNNINKTKIKLYILFI